MSINIKAAKILLLAAVFLCFNKSISFAQGYGSSVNKVYVGIDRFKENNVSNSSSRYGTFGATSRLRNISPNFGVRLTKYAAIEGSYSAFENRPKSLPNIPSSSQLKNDGVLLYSAINLDALFYLPLSSVVNDSGIFEFVLGGGVARSRVKYAVTQENGTHSATTQSKLEYKIIGGMQVALFKSSAIRFLVQRHSANYLALPNNLVSYKVGYSYYF